MKEHSIINFRYLILAIFTLLLSSCYYDVEEELYGPLDCVPVDVSYKNDVAPIMDNYCNNCHSQANQSGGVRTDNYTELKIIADNGRLLGSIKDEDGYTAMPQGIDPLSSCNISKIEVWISEGTQNN